MISQKYFEWSLGAGRMNLIHSPRNVVVKLKVQSVKTVRITFMCTSSEIALKWMPLNTIDNKSTSVQVMAWCRQATSHYLSQCWPWSMLPYGKQANSLIRISYVTHIMWFINTLEGKKKGISWRKFNINKFTWHKSSQIGINSQSCCYTSQYQIWKKKINKTITWHNNYASQNNNCLGQPLKHYNWKWSNII